MLVLLAAVPDSYMSGCTMTCCPMDSARGKAVRIARRMGLLISTALLLPPLFVSISSGASDSARS
jgi:hypothetical protein